MRSPILFFLKKMKLHRLQSTSNKLRSIYKQVTKYVLGARETVHLFKLDQLRYLLLRIYPLIHNLFHSFRQNMMRYLFEKLSLLKQTFLQKIKANFWVLLGLSFIMGLFLGEFTHVFQFVRTQLVMLGLSIIKLNLEPFDVYKGFFLVCCFCLFFCGGIFFAYGVILFLTKTKFESDTSILKSIFWGTFFFSIEFLILMYFDRMEDLAYLLPIWWPTVWQNWDGIFFFRILIFVKFNLNLVTLCLKIYIEKKLLWATKTKKFLHLILKGSRFVFNWGISLSLFKCFYDYLQKGEYLLNHFLFGHLRRLLTTEEKIHSISQTYSNFIEHFHLSLELENFYLNRWLFVFNNFKLVSGVEDFKTFKLLSGVEEKLNVWVVQNMDILLEKYNAGSVAGIKYLSQVLEDQKKLIETGELRRIVLFRNNFNPKWMDETKWIDETIQSSPSFFQEFENVRREVFQIFYDFGIELSPFHFTTWEEFFHAWWTVVHGSLTGLVIASVARIFVIFFFEDTPVDPPGTPNIEPPTEPSTPESPPLPPLPPNNLPLQPPNNLSLQLPNSVQVDAEVRNSPNLRLLEFVDNDLPNAWPDVLDPNALPVTVVPLALPETESTVIPMILPDLLPNTNALPVAVVNEVQPNTIHVVSNEIPENASNEIVHVDSNSVSEIVVDVVFNEIPNEIPNSLSNDISHSVPRLGP